MTSTWIVTGLLALNTLLAWVCQQKPEALGIPEIVFAWLPGLALVTGLVLNRLDALGASKNTPDPGASAD